MNHLEGIYNTTGKTGKLLQKVLNSKGQFKKYRSSLSVVSGRLIIICTFSNRKSYKTSHFLQNKGIQNNPPPQ